MSEDRTFPVQSNISSIEAIPNRENSETINLLDYLEVISNRWKTIVSITITVFFISAIIAFILPKYYSSTARILPPQQDSGLMGMMMGSMGGGAANIASDLLGKGTTADLYVGMLNSETIKDSVIDKFNLMEVYDQKFRIDTYKVLDRYVDISLGKKDGIISISVEDKDPKRAAEIANTFVEELGKFTVRLNINDASVNKDFIKSRLIKANVDLAKSENSLKLFQSKNKMLDVNQQAKASIEGVALLRAQLSSLEVQLATVSRQFTDNSQEVKTIRSSIDKLKQEIRKIEGEGGGGAIPNVGTVPSLGQEYLRIMREFKIQEAIVELLSKQYEMTDLSESKDVVSMQILQKARIPDKKSRPKRSIIIISMTIISFIGSILFVFIVEATSHMSADNRRRFKNILANLPIPTRFKSGITSI